MATQDRSVARLVWSAIGGFAVITVVTALLTPAIVSRFYPLLPDRGASWYYWQLPAATTLTRITYWVGYALHQIVVWGLLIHARHASDRTAASRGVGRFNWIVMGVNLAFVALHLVQTWLWYDGLAQDVPIWTSQGSVIVMLVLILFLEIPRRGLVWGKTFKAPARTYAFVQRWHGLYISWAIVYTFWFHPMDGNWGLLSGFIYMFLLFIQISMFRTPLHMNRAWIVLLEAGVIVHATLITVYKANPIWPMFMVGFMVMFFLTQMHALSWARKWRWPILAAFVLGVAALYIFVRGVEHLYEITFIPVALYGGTIGLLIVGWVIERLASRKAVSEQAA